MSMIAIALALAVAQEADEALRAFRDKVRGAASLRVRATVVCEGQAVELAVRVRGSDRWSLDRKPDLLVPYDGHRIVDARRPADRGSPKRNDGA